MSQPTTTVRPPQWPLRLMRALVKEEYIEEIEGDMEEIFLNNVEELSLKEARRKYIWDTLKLCRPVLLKNFKTAPTFNQHAMFRNYFKVAYRNLLKKKAYSFINISGLGLGIACCILIFMYVTDELSYDNYHEKGARIYRLTHGEAAKDGTTPYPFWVWGNAPVGPALKNDFAEVDKIVQFSGRSDILLTYEDRMFQEDGVFFMDSTAFDVFTWKLLKGNPKTALAAPFSIVLTETTARKYFGNEDPIGKTLKGSESAGRSNAGDYTVTGVMEDVPANSHFKFNALLSLNTFRKSNPDIFNEWGYVDIYTYFLVNDHFDEAAFTKKLPDFVKHYIKNPEWRYTVKIEPLKDAYLRTTAERQPGETGSLSNIYIFSIIGLFILVIAVINFMNLSTARSLERSKEVGVRKSIGADRKSLVSQFLGESLIIVSLSAVVAIAMVVIALPYMVAFTGKNLELQNFINLQTIALFLAAMLVIGLLAGSYPAMVLSGFNPVLILKGVSRVNSGGGTNLRQALVVFQFSLSIALIAGTMIVYTQMNHLLDKDLGFDNEQMLVLDYNYDQAVNQKSERIKTELEKDPSVVSVAFSRSVPGSYFPHAGTEIETPDGEMKMIGQPIFQVGLDFVTHFGLKLIAGRAYSREYPSDSAQALVVNEAAARQFGYQNPADVVGKKFDQWGRKGVVIGVVKDFNFTSLHRTIEPLTLPFEAYASRYLSVKIKADNLDETIRHIGEVWKQTAPNRPFLYSFLDENFNRQYKADFIFRRLFTTFACLAIFIACLGLLGLATYTAQQRNKEIGIRKVLGADVRSIVGLLSRDFIKLVLIAVLIATPVAWYAMNKWLEGFAYHIELSPWIFVASGCIALAIAVFTISFQSIKAALVNPVSSLKSE